MRNEMVVSISSVIARIKNVLTQTMDLDGIWIQGEISNLCLLYTSDAADEL